MSNELKKPTADIRIPRNIPELIATALFLRDHLVNHPKVLVTNPTLEVFSADILALQEMHSQAKGGVRGASRVRNARAKTVRKDITKLIESVQVVADAQPTPDEGAALIESVGMVVKGARRFIKAQFSVKQLPTSGSVLLVARASARKAMYFWEMSEDLVTWTEVGRTLRAKHAVTGLTPGRLYHFRFRSHTQQGLSEPSPVVSLIVI